jgi:hypothetical protein
VNGPRHFAAFAAKYGRLMDGDGVWWVRGAHYRISFWPSAIPTCRNVASYPYWTWPGGGSPGIYVLYCDPPPDQVSHP